MQKLSIFDHGFAREVGGYDIDRWIDHQRRATGVEVNRALLNPIFE